MGLYLGGEQLKVLIGNTVCKINLYAASPITNGVLLKTVDGDLLKDSSALYLTAKDGV